MPLLTLSFHDGSESFAIDYQSSAMPDIAVGDIIPLRFDPSNPSSATPAADVAGETSRRRSFAVFSGIIGLIAVLAAVASNIDNAGRSTSQHRGPPPVAAG